MNESGTSGYLRRGFNRYMVECEFVYIKLDCIDICVLIDTWWNVNLILPFLCLCQYLF